MKIIIKNSSLVFKKARQLYTGIFNVASTRVNTIIKDGCAPTNNFTTQLNGDNVNMSRNIEEVHNTLGLTYNTVYRRVDELYNGNYYDSPFINSGYLNITQKQTLGYWITQENISSIEIIPHDMTGWVFDGDILLIDENPITQTGLINNIQCTVTAKRKNITIGTEKWAFVQVQFLFDEVPTSNFYTLLAKGKNVINNEFAENPVYIANLTLINDIVELDPMTYYPALGHNPQKDPNL